MCLSPSEKEYTLILNKRQCSYTHLINVQEAAAKATAINYLMWTHIVNI